MRKIFFGLFVSGFCITALFYAYVAASEEYTVEKYDTLWDISDTRLEDPFLWPKLWNVNPHIDNPDLIYPGNILRIPSREELLRMPLSGTTKMPVPKKRRVRKKEPESIWRFATMMEKSDIIDKKLYIASGWISDTFPGIGKISYAPERRQIFGRDDILYLTLDDDYRDTSRFLVIRDIKTVRHPQSDEEIGHQIRVAGIVEVLGMEKDMPKAKVISSFEDIQLGDSLLPYEELEPPALPDEARTPDIHGYIIESHLNSFLLSEGDVLFLDKGENDGLSVGDVFSVLAEDPTERSIGEIQIVSLQPETAGAVLKQGSQEITIGFRWAQKVN